MFAPYFVDQTNLQLSRVAAQRAARNTNASSLLDDGADCVVLREKHSVQNERMLVERMLVERMLVERMLVLTYKLVYCSPHTFKDTSSSSWGTG